MFYKNDATQDYWNFIDDHGVEYYIAQEYVGYDGNEFGIDKNIHLKINGKFLSLAEIHDRAPFGGGSSYADHVRDQQISESMGF